MTLSMTIPSASAVITDPPDYSVSTAVETAEGTYSFQITVRKPSAFEAYSGVTFWIRLPSGVTFGEISYSLPGGVEWPPAQAPTLPGNYNLGYWAGSNIFTGDIICVINVNYTGTSETSLTITEIGQNIFRQQGGTDQLVANPNTPVTLKPSGTTDPNKDKDDDGDDKDKDDKGDNSVGGGKSGSGNLTPIPGANIEETDPPLTEPFPFTDVEEDDWFYSDVYYMWENKLMNGTSETLFSPNIALTRGMVVTVLWRMEGSPDADDLEMPFSDVASGTWYYDAVKWAAENGIVTGYENGTFCPDNTIYRQDLALVLNRYADFAETELTATREYAAFNDNAKIDTYAKDAVETLYKSGIINGKTGNNFDPKGSATRAEFAAILHRLLDRETEEQ